MTTGKPTREERLLRSCGDSAFVRALVPHGQRATRILNVLHYDTLVGAHMATDEDWRAFFSRHQRRELLKRKNMGETAMAVLDVVLEGLGWEYAPPPPPKKPKPSRLKKHSCPKCGHSW